MSPSRRRKKSRFQLRPRWQTLSGSSTSSTGSSRISLLDRRRRYELYIELIRHAGVLCEDPDIEQWAIGAFVDAAVDLAKGVAGGHRILDTWITERGGEQA
ncbi:MAG: hypothetical protein QXT28_11985 [Thermofilaceae archaeon]